jgi:hypothetical protein
MKTFEPARRHREQPEEIMKEQQEKPAKYGMAIIFAASLTVCVFAAALFISGCGGG